MLTSDEKAQLIQALCMTAELMGASLSPHAAVQMADDLEQFEMAALTQALKACRQEAGRFTLAAVLDRVRLADGRPGRDEAWSIALAAADEFDTVVMTEEVRQAMSVARPLLAARDTVGARMAFLSAYDRLVEIARRDGRAVQWQTSIGFDPQRRVAAIEDALRMQRLPAPVAAAEIRRLGLIPLSREGRAIAGLLTSDGTPEEATLPEETRKRLEGIRESLREARKLQATQRDQRIAAERKELLARKRAQAALTQGGRA